MAELTVAAYLPTPLSFPLDVPTVIYDTPAFPLDIQTVTTSAVVFTYDPDAGTFTLAGTVKQLGSPNQPLRRRVNLIEEVSGRVIRETWSDATTGAYAFAGIAGGRTYSVISYDHANIYRAVIADKLQPTAP
jgi:hypothetical protein